MVRLRSPQYPAITLPDALERVRKLIETSGPGPISRRDAVKGIGFSAETGFFHTAFSATRKFGLLEKKEDGYRVTPLATAILSPTSPEDRSKALSRALRQPLVYRAIEKHFGHLQPPDSDLQQFLVNAKYTESAIRRLMSAFQASVEYVFETSQPARVAEVMMPRSGLASADPFSVRFTGDRIEISGVLLDVEKVEKLQAALEAAKVLLPRK